MEQLFGVELRSEADDFIHLTMKMKNGRTKILENQGFRTCRFYFIKIYMEFDYYLSINVVFWDNLSNLFLCNCHKKYSFSIRIVISEFLPKRSYFLPKTQTILHYRTFHNNLLSITDSAFLICDCYYFTHDTFSFTLC